jgi:hypothetical protein
MEDYMETYAAINSADKRKMQKPLLIGFGLIFVAAAFASSIPFIALGLFLIFIAFYKKTIEADENGITTYYDFLVHKTSISYPFTEFSNIIVDVGLHETIMAFRRKGTTTFASFKPEDAEKVVALAENANERLKVDYARLKANKISL